MNLGILLAAIIITIAFIGFVIFVFNKLHDRGRKMKGFLTIKVIGEFMALILMVYTALERANYTFGNLEAIVFVLTIFDLMESLSDLIEWFKK